MKKIIFYTVLVLLVALNTPVYAQISFAPKVDYPVRIQPRSVFSADLDGDGDNDLAVANADNTVSVLLNNGDGTFAAKVDYGAGFHPVSVFSVDLDGDGDNDLAVANEDDFTVSVLLNNGDGTFVAHVTYIAGGQEVTSVFSVDLDGDGDNDLAVSNTQSHSVSVLLNNGDGTFAAKVGYATGLFPGSVFSADLDGDGDNDLAVANAGSATVSVLLNDGFGIFAPKVDYGVGNSPQSVSSVDLDGDGDNDLVVANELSDSVSVLLNNGNGTFAPKVDYGTGDGPVSVFSADVDGDGDNDLAVANFTSATVSVFLNNGNGTFVPKVDFATGAGPRLVFSTDLDGDGDNDLAVANNGSATVSVLLNLSNVTPPLDVTSISPISGPVSGGTPVVIKGSNFQSGATVAIDGSPATGVAVASSDTITAVTPAHPAGTVDVIVTNPDGQADTLSNGFEFVVANQPPVADAGSDQVVIVGDSVQLDGSGSSDPDADSLSYNWEFITKPTGSAAVISNASPVTPTFVADVAGEYVVQMVVNDGTEDSAPDQVTITVQTPQEAIEEVIDQVDSLFASGTLNQGQTNSLATKLDRVIQKLDRDNVNAAINQLQAFINHVESFIAAGVLLPEEGLPLIDAVNNIIDQLSQPSARIAAASPTTFALGQNYPNPFNHETVIHYDLPVRGRVDISVFNIMG